MKDINDAVLHGSAIAKNGFRNEQEIADKFNNWNNDSEAQSWLQIMQYNLDDIEYVKAVVIHGYKADVNVQITIKLTNLIDVENLQVKLVSNKKGYNQVDKRWVDNYVCMWKIPDDVTIILKHFTGELKPKINRTKDKRRMFITEFDYVEQRLLIEFLDKNKTLIISDILRGRGQFAAEWVLVAQKTLNNARWTLKSINEVINHYSGNGEITITPHGSIKIGKLTMQRKGGDGGRNTANMLQFKIDPTELFDI